MKIGLAYNVLPEESVEAGQNDRFDEYDEPETIERLQEVLEQLGNKVVRLGAGRAFLDAVRSEPCDLVFNIAEGAGGRSREAHVPAVCELLGIPYTHSDPLTLAATLDKSVAKAVVAAAGINTPAHMVIEHVDETVDLWFPVIAKPLAEGTRMGLRPSSRVQDAAALRSEAARLLADYEQPVLVEEFCPGAELTVGVFGTGASAEAAGVMEIVPAPGEPIEHWVYTVDVKRLGPPALSYHAPPDRPLALIEETLALGVAAHRALRCQDVSRVDIRLDAEGRPSFLESNPLPGLREGFSDLLCLTDGYGISFEEVINRILSSARKRLGL
jgi:D-alanine-D-alanine ligase